MRQLSAALTLSIIGVVSIAEAQTGWTGDVRTIFTTVFPTPFNLAATAVEPNGNAYAIWTVGDSATSSTSRIEVARYVAATDSWGVPITLAGPGQFGLPKVAVDTSGNAFFLVPQVLGGRAQIEVIRHESVSATNTTTLVSQIAFGGGIKVDAAGNAMVVWSEDAGIFAARYDVALATSGATHKDFQWECFLPGATGLGRPRSDRSHPSRIGLCNEHDDTRRPKRVRCCKG